MHKQADKVMAQVAARLAEGQFRRVTLFCGSIVSRGTPCGCPDVGEMRQLIMRTLSFSSAGQEGLSEVLQELSHDATFERPAAPVSALQESFYSLPFEQFMGCLSAVGASVARSIVEAAYGKHLHGRPNGNHKAVARIARTVLDRDLCYVVNILTTNYDVGFEQALEEIGLRVVHSAELRLAPGAPMLTAC